MRSVSRLNSKQWQIVVSRLEGAGFSPSFPLFQNIYQKPIDMRTNQVKNSQMNHHTSLEAQYAAAGSQDFSRAIKGLELHGFTIRSMRKEDGVFLLRSADATWTVEVTQMGSVRTWNESSNWTDFFTWQLQNQGRLLGWDDETPDFETTTIPCDCGNPNAVWRGDKRGRRMYVCDECAKHFPELK